MSATTVGLGCDRRPSDGRPLLRTEYIGTLVERAFDTMSGVMSMHQSFSWLFGSARRISDVLLVLDELEADAAANAKRVAATEEAATPRRGERICLSDATIATPDGQSLAHISFSVEANGRSNLLVTGPSDLPLRATARVLPGFQRLPPP